MESLTGDTFPQAECVSSQIKRMKIRAARKEKAVTHGGQLAPVLVGALQRKKDRQTAGCPDCSGVGGAELVSSFSVLCEGVIPMMGFTGVIRILLNKKKTTARLPFGICSGLLCS